MRVNTTTNSEQSHNALDAMDIISIPSIITKNDFITSI